MASKNFLNLINWISGDVAIDLGTANTLIWLKGRGIVVNEPSIVTRNVLDDTIVAVGDEAKAMLGKTHRELETIRPLQDGVIADFKMTDGMLQGFIRKINLNRLARPRMVICVPSGVTEVERRAVKDSGERANAREVYLIEEPVAAAIGIGLDISQPIGNIIVDIGGGTTEIAVISLNGVVNKETIRLAGDEMDDAVLQWFSNEHTLEIGLGMSESIKKSVGSAMKMNSSNIAVKGRDLVSGIPKTIEVSSDEIRQALKDPVNQIVEAVKRCLEQTPPELAADILERGIILAGGGSLLKGIDQIIDEKFVDATGWFVNFIFYQIQFTEDIKVFWVLFPLILGATYFTIYFKFINFRGILTSINIVRGKYDSVDHHETLEAAGDATPGGDSVETIAVEGHEGEVSHFQALTAALSATVGLGNIAGVAIAVSIGGAGATFWMIIAGLLGMASKFVECTLGVKYRDIDENGVVYGGPMYYLTKGLKSKGLEKL